MERCLPTSLIFMFLLDGIGGSAILDYDIHFNLTTGVGY